MSWRVFALFVIDINSEYSFDILEIDFETEEIFPTISSIEAEDSTIPADCAEISFSRICISSILLSRTV